MRMCMLASISIVIPTKDFPIVPLLHAARSFINDVPQMAIQRAFVRSRKIPLSGSFQCCLLGQLPKCSDLSVMIWNQVCAVRCNNGRIPLCEAEITHISQLDHYIFSIFCLRVASILEQCAACLSLSTGR